jgi:hypothetical protein
MQNKHEPEYAILVKDLLPLLQAWKDWVPSKSPDARVSAVNNGILQGQEWAHDDLLHVLGRQGIDVAGLRQTITTLEGCLADAEGEARGLRREEERLTQELAEAQEEIGRLKYAYSTTNAVLDGQGKLLAQALGHLEKIHDTVLRADEEFNFTGNYDPDGAPDAPEGGR